MATSRLARAPYGRTDRRDGSRPIPTYYDRPVLKPSPYGWRIAAYFFVGGLAGSAQLLSAVADLVPGRRLQPVVRTGRYLALGGAIVGPALLVADLHTPQRWFNMFRIFRRTSPMSIGSFTLAGLGALSAPLAAAEIASTATGDERWRRLVRPLSPLAAVAGALTSIYTGVLLAATSVPAWAAAPRLLPGLFGASAVSSATAALALASPRQRRGLDRLAVLSGLVELALSLGLERRWRGVGLRSPFEARGLRLAYRGGAQALGVALPVLVHASRLGRSRSVASLASIATLLGGVALRAVLVLAGNRSAEQPRDYLRFTQPGAGAAR